MPLATRGVASRTPGCGIYADSLCFLHNMLVADMLALYWPLAVALPLRGHVCAPCLGPWQTPAQTPELDDEAATPTATRTPRPTAASATLLQEHVSFKTYSEGCCLRNHLIEIRLAILRSISNAILEITR